MNKKAKPSEFLEDAADWNAALDISMSAAEKQTALDNINKSILKARQDIKDGKGIPADVVFERMRMRIAEKSKTAS